jgi:hypothetical protein
MFSDIFRSFYFLIKKGANVSQLLTWWTMWLDRIRWVWYQAGLNQVRVSSWTVAVSSIMHITTNITTGGV